MTTPNRSSTLNTIDIDTGGTFTDGVFVHGGRRTTVKVDTTPHDPVRCFVECMRAGAGRLDLDLGALLAEADVVRYSTTAGTNAIIQRRGTRVGLITTAGHEEDLLGQPDDAAIRTFVDRELVRGVRTDGGLDTEGFRAAVEQLLDAGARLLVVALAGAGTDPTAELEAKRVFDAAFPAFYLGRPFLLLSHQVSAADPDSARLNSAVISGYLHRDLVGYLYRCDDAVRDHGAKRPLLIVHATGGVARVAKTQALQTLNSGPTAGVFGAARAAARLGVRRAITMDMGGTSTDVAFIEDGVPRMRSQADVHGVALNLPMIDVIGLGGGGGSIARAEDGRVLVGPTSAGAVPGPACYDLGNPEPTVTDADVAVGLVSATGFLGGTRKLNVERARSAIEDRLGTPLGVDVEEAARRVHSSLAGQLAEEIRREATDRGVSLDRDWALFAYGGAGPVHAAELASALGVGTFYVFADSPVFSAAGSSGMSVEHLYEARLADGNGGADPDAARERLLDRARRDLRGEGLDPESAEMDVSVDADTVRLKASVAIGTGEDAVRASSAGETADSARGTRDVAWAGGTVATPVHDFHALADGASVPGPALIDAGETTCVVPEGWTATKADATALRVAAE